MHFGNKFHFAIPLWGDKEFWVTDTTISTWLVGFILIAFAIFVRIKLTKFKDKPTGFQNFIEFLVEMMHNFTVSTMTEKFSYYGAWFFGIFAFILCSNFAGLFARRPPTADLATTAGLALSTFLMIHISGIVIKKGKYFKEFFEPVPLFFPIHLIGELALPVSLSFRLFGNILGGVIILGLIYGFLPYALRFGLPGVLNVYFDIFAGSLQAFIFTILSMVSIKNKIVHEE